MRFKDAFWSGLCCFLLMIWSPAWAAKPDFPVPVGNFAPLSAPSEQIWQNHLTQVAQQPIQAACRPFRLPAAGRRRGSAVLLHGFSACPQQYWDVAPMLAEAGFDVFVPLLPGHGLVYQQEQARFVDQVDAMPTDPEHGRYRDFALSLADLLSGENGRRLLIGLSVGSAVGAEALSLRPAAFDRALLMAPLFDVVAPQNLYLPPLNLLFASRLAEWGPGCELERAGGRGGYCQFRLTHLRATQLLGLAALDRMNQIRATVQIVGVEGDGAANNAAIAAGVRHLNFGSGCLYRRGANHSLFSRYDAPDEDKFWLPDLERQVLRFATTGEFFATEQRAYDAGLPRCLISD